MQLKQLIQTVMVPLIAGMLEMPRQRFLLTNIASAIVWAPVYMFPGYLFGLSLEVASEFAGRFLILLHRRADRDLFTEALGLFLARCRQEPAVIAQAVALTLKLTLPVVDLRSLAAADRAAEIAQEVFLRVYLHRKRYR